MGNMIELLSGKAADQQEGNYLDIEETTPGTWTITADSMTGEETSLGISQWDETVTDLDNGDSDASQCFEMSEHLQWEDVTIYPDHFVAADPARIQEAVQHVLFCAWDPMDV